MLCLHEQKLALHGDEKKRFNPEMTVCLIVRANVPNFKLANLIV